MNNNRLRLIKINTYKTINNYINSLFKIEPPKPKIHYIDFDKIKANNITIKYDKLTKRA